MKAHQAEYPIATQCRVLGVSTSGYYAWLKRAPSARSKANAELLEEIKKSHKKSDGTYGAPRIHADLPKEMGASLNRVARVMCDVGIQGVTRRKWTKTTVRDEDERAAPDLVDRDFTATGPDQLWVADITYIPTWAGFLYLAVVMDVEPSDRGLGDGDTPQDGAGAGRVEHGAPATTARGCGPSLGPGKPGWIQEVVATPQERGGVAMAASKRRRSDRALRPPMCSPGRPTVGRREHRQRFWEEVARGLSSEKSAVAAGVSPAVGARWFRQCGGMPPFSLRPLSGRYLSFVEREEIAVLHAGGCGVREIARQLGRSPSTISRELRRNAATRSGNLEYRATAAQWHADRRAKTSESCQTRCKQRTEAVCAGSPWRPDRGSRRGGRAGPQFTLGRASPWADKTGGGRPRGVQSRSPTGYGSTFPMMSPCGYRTKPFTRRSTFRDAVLYVGS